MCFGAGPVRILSQKNACEFVEPLVCIAPTPALLCSWYPGQLIDQSCTSKKHPESDSPAKHGRIGEAEAQKHVPGWQTRRRPLAPAPPCPQSAGWLPDPK
jgi:hypothetical protein